MYSVQQLRILALAYLAVTETTESALGVQICGNQKFIKGLLAGGDCKARNAELASEFFNRKWPAHAAWPLAVPRDCRRRRHLDTEAAGS